MNQEDIMQGLLPDELNTYQELFSFFDKQDSGNIPINDVGMFIRGLGHCPTQKQLKEIMQEFGYPEKKEVSFPELICMVAKRPKQENIQEQLLEAFEAYQAQIGNMSEGSKNSFISVIGLRKFLCENGQTLSEPEIQNLIEFLKANDLKVNQQQFNFRELTKILAYNYFE